ncbi:MAG TPA: hypothetical protein VFR63_14605 [Gaiellaceae bacterium]|nr:hypothetical protein [Gaiellaceae bacterium]
MATPPTDAPSRRGLRDSGWGKALLLLLVLGVAFLVARTCGSSRPDEVTQEEAIEIAREEIDYEADRVLVRVVRRGIPPRSYWAVSLQDLEGGNIEQVTVVVVDGTTGDVTEIREE